jgi:RNA recognition motif-containing protein
MSENNSGRVDPGRGGGDPGIRKIFIGGLSYETDDEKLRRYFSTYGTVQDSVVMKDPATRRSRGFGFITFGDAASVDRTLNIESHTIDSRKVEAKRAVPRSEVNRESPTTFSAKENPSTSNANEEVGTNKSSQSPTSRTHSITSKSSHESFGELNKSKDEGNPEPAAMCKIFVGGLHYDTRDAEFRSYFEKYGTVVSAEVMFNRETHKSRGFGFIIFETISSVDSVCAHGDHIIDGKVVEVKRAIPRSRLGSGSSAGSMISGALNSSRSMSNGSSLGTPGGTPPVSRRPSSTTGGSAGNALGSAPIPPTVPAPITASYATTKPGSYAAALKLGASAQIGGSGVSAVSGEEQGNTTGNTIGNNIMSLSVMGNSGEGSVGETSTSKGLRSDSVSSLGDGSLAQDLSMSGHGHGGLEVIGQRVNTAGVISSQANNQNIKSTADSIVKPGSSFAAVAARASVPGPGLHAATSQIQLPGAPHSNSSHTRQSPIINSNTDFPLPGDIRATNAASDVASVGSGGGNSSTDAIASSSTGVPDLSNAMAQSSRHQQPMAWVSGDGINDQQQNVDVAQAHAQAQAYAHQQYMMQQMHQQYPQQNQSYGQHGNQLQWSQQQGYFPHMIGGPGMFPGPGHLSTNAGLMGMPPIPGRHNQNQMAQSIGNDFKGWDRPRHDSSGLGNNAAFLVPPSSHNRLPDGLTSGYGSGRLSSLPNHRNPGVNHLSSVQAGGLGIGLGLGTGQSTWLQPNSNSGTDDIGHVAGGGLRSEEDDGGFSSVLRGLRLDSPEENKRGFG